MTDSRTIRNSFECAIALATASYATGAIAEQASPELGKAIIDTVALLAFVWVLPPGFGAICGLLIARACHPTRYKPGHAFLGFIAGYAGMFIGGLAVAVVAPRSGAMAATIVFVLAAGVPPTVEYLYAASRNTSATEAPARSELGTGILAGTAILGIFANYLFMPWVAMWALGLFGPGSWKSEGNGERGQLRFELLDPLAYADAPLRLQVRKGVVRVGDGYGQRHSEHISVREARCEPATLCRVAVVAAPASQNDWTAELAVTFASAGDGRILVTAKDGFLSTVSDTWKIAADPPPDDIAAEVPANIRPGSMVAIPVSAMSAGRALRGPVVASLVEVAPTADAPTVRVEQERATKGAGECWERRAIECSANPVASFAKPRTVWLDTKRPSRATLLLKAGAVERRIPVLASIHVGSAEIEIYACDRNVTDRPSGVVPSACSALADRPARCKAGSSVFAHVIVRDTDGQLSRYQYGNYGRWPLVAEPTGAVSVGYLAMIARQGASATATETIEATRVNCMVPGVATLKLPVDLADGTGAREILVEEAATSR